MNFIHVPATLPDSPMDLDGFRGLDLLADLSDSLASISLSRYLLVPAMVPAFSLNDTEPIEN